MDDIKFGPNPVPLQLMGMESWSKTHELRIKRVNVGDIGHADWVDILQQMWQGSQGSHRWEDVPVVINGSP